MQPTVMLCYVLICVGFEYVTDPVWACPYTIYCLGRHPVVSVANSINKENPVKQEDHLNNLKQEYMSA